MALKFTRLIMALGLFVTAIGGGLRPQMAIASANCQYVLGFQTLYALIPSTVGDCEQNEYFNPANDDSLQQTTSGLLVWRKADNWTAFTDGYHTWINGPNGVQERLNTERFCWEGDAGASIGHGMCAIAPSLDGVISALNADQIADLCALYPNGSEKPYYWIYTIYPGTPASIYAINARRRHLVDIGLVVHGYFLVPRVANVLAQRGYCH